MVRVAATTCFGARRTLGGLRRHDAREAMIEELEFRRWHEHARRTLESARRDMGAGDHNWACFKAEQAAQFAVKGLLRALGHEAFGHSLLRLLDDPADIGVGVPTAVQDAARSLEALDIASRYPDVYPSGTPSEFFDATRAAEAIDHARLVIRFTEERHRDGRDLEAEKS